MSQAINSTEKTLEAAADLSTKQYFIVKVDTNGKLALASSALDPIVGVLQNKPIAGEGALYRFGGTSKVKLGGTVAAGAWVTTDANGEGVATTTDGNITVGMALEAGVDADIIELQLNIQHLYIA